MSEQTPTSNAVSGKFQSKNGDDLVQYVDGQGRVVLWVDSNGVLHVKPGIGPTAIQVHEGYTD
jgi:hypothetical protein